MDSAAGFVPDARPLTREEHRLARWMLENGGPDAAAFLPQLERARVVAGCPCGCATLELEVEGEPAPAGGTHVLSDWWWTDGAGHASGIFLSQRGGVLAGMEVYALKGDTPRTLPAPESLSPLAP
jgi:hypothetical protein